MQGKFRLIYIGLGVVALMAIGLLWAYQQQRSEIQRIHQEKDALSVEVERLRLERVQEPAPVESIAPAAGVPVMPGNDEPAEEWVEFTAPSARAPDVVPTPTGYARAPRSSGLVLAETRAEPIEGGLRAILRFTPTDSQPLGIVAITVRLPVGSESRILGLDAVGDMTFTDVSGRVSDDGTFAVFHGTAAGTGLVGFALSVSAPCRADVRGTTGIGPYELDIDSSGATVVAK
jgi:hypothetical protein